MLEPSPAAPQAPLFMKPCPFCGDSFSSVRHDHEQISLLVVCSKCGATGPRCSNFPDAEAVAVERWNLRP